MDIIIGLPVDATHTIICPTVKDKKGDLSSILNYRPIALATIFSKILEHIILDRIYEHLDSTDNQFGFKRKHNTLMPVLLLKEILRFYRDHNTNMYICFLDATKAFDRGDYAVLFQKLLSRNVPGYIVKFLWNWYSKHCARILWAGILSDSFVICNGVRQGGILSPFLFALYRERDREAHLNYYASAYNRGRQLSHRKTKLNRIRQNKHASLTKKCI